MLAMLGLVLSVYVVLLLLYLLLPLLSLGGSLIVVGWFDDALGRFVRLSRIGF